MINKMKSKTFYKKGISLMVLAIVIIVMLILLGIVIVNSNIALTSVNKAKLQTDIAQLETLMNTYRIRKNGVIDFETVEFDTSNLTEQELKQFSGEVVSDDKIILYVIDLVEIDADSVNFGNLASGQTDRYLYSISTQKVYYELGLPLDGTTYYYVKGGEV